MMADQSRMTAGDAVQILQSYAANRRSSERIAEPLLTVSHWRATVRDVSVGGICLELDEPTRCEGLYHLTLTDGAYCFGKDVAAEVMWQRGKQVGFRWLRLTEDQQLWLNLCARTWEREPFPIRVSFD